MPHADELRMGKRAVREGDLDVCRDRNAVLVNKAVLTGDGQARRVIRRGRDQGGDLRELLPGVVTCGLDLKRGRGGGGRLLRAGDRAGKAHHARGHEHCADCRGKEDDGQDQPKGARALLPMPATRCHEATSARIRSNRAYQRRGRQGTPQETLHTRGTKSSS